MPMTLVPGEIKMWAGRRTVPQARMGDQDINEKYELRERRIVTESNREKLPNFVDALSRPNYIDLRPFYQRRERWDTERQSRLIESFIINIPVPPLFLYERAYNSYEVMDGQQRINAIAGFYRNEFALRGLELWPELNGRRYSELPGKIRAGIDRRSVSYIVLLKESAESDEDALLLKQLVFERLNTGGVRLAHQEVRNCLYQGPLNNLLIELSRNAVFAEAWNVPRHSIEEETNPSDELRQNKLYTRMGDAEIVLRFFALRHAENFRNGVNGFLDLYMIRGRSFDAADIEGLRSLFERTIDLARRIYGTLLFRPYDAETQDWSSRAHKAYYDAVMVGFSRHLNRAEELVGKREAVIEATRRLFVTHEKGTFTGRGNTKADIQERLELFASMLATV